MVITPTTGWNAGPEFAADRYDLFPWDFSPSVPDGDTIDDDHSYGYMAALADQGV